MLWLTVLVFVGLLLLLVLAHEWGHFIAAKKAGCEVEEFGFGFPPRLASFTRHGTRYSFNLLPIGGFVKIKGEDMDDPEPGPGSFASKSATWRVVILSAGVIMNVAVAVVLLGIQGIIGVPTVITEANEAELEGHLTFIAGVAPRSPAADAGVRAGDRIVSIAGTVNPTLEEVQQTATDRAGTPVQLEVDRLGQRETFEITPRREPPANEGALGITLATTGLARVPWWQVPGHALVRTWEMIVAIIIALSDWGQKILQGEAAGDTLTGPIGIARYTHETVKLGASYVLELGALISLNLALFNILPIPALDGGRILFVALQKLFGQRLSGRIEHVSHTVGFALLIALMVAITFRDIQRFF